MKDQHLVGRMRMLARELDYAAGKLDIHGNKTRARMLGIRGADCAQVGGGNQHGEREQIAMIDEKVFTEELAFIIRCVKVSALRDVARDLYALEGERYIYAAKFVEDRADEVENGK